MEDVVININDDESNGLGNRDLIPKTEVEFLLDKKESDFNSYATSKSVSQEFLNTGTIQAEISLIVGLFASRDNSLPLRGFEIALITMVSLSLVIQFIMFILLFVLAAAKKEQISKRCTATMINSLVTSLSGLSLIINIVVSVVSVEAMKLNIAPTRRMGVPLGVHIMHSYISN